MMIRDKINAAYHLSHSKPMKYIGFPRPTYPLGDMLESGYFSSSNFLRKNIKRPLRYILIVYIFVA